VLASRSAVSSVPASGWSTTVRAIGCLLALLCGYLPAPDSR
jgi:hypothetical protein